MFKKVLFMFLICLCSNILLAQATRIKSIARTNGEWANQLIFDYSWASLIFRDHYSENQHTFTIAAKTPLIYYGPFLKKGLLSEVYHPLNNSATSRWFGEDMIFSSDMSLTPGLGQILFLGESAGGYLLKKAEKPLVTGIIINYPVDSSIELDLHVSQSKQPKIKEDDWYFVQKPFWGHQLFHPALGVHYQNHFLKLNAFILAALSSLGERAYCGSLLVELKQNGFISRFYAGKKEASFINPFGESSQRAFESHLLFQWKPQRRLEFKQSLLYQIDWPEKPQTFYFSGKTESESQVFWLIHDEKKEQLTLTGNFQWTRDFKEPQNPQDSLKSTLSSKLAFHGLSLALSAGCNMTEAINWQINNSLGYDNDFFEGKLSQRWTISQAASLEYKVLLKWKRNRTRVFLEIKSLKPFKWDESKEDAKDFFEQNRLSLGWESLVDNETKAE